MKKLLVISVVFLFFSMIIFPSSGIQIDNKIIISSNRGNTLYVGGNGPDNYTLIQDAIDNAVDGDAIYVYSGTYYENIVIIEKTISLNGENNENTIIDGNKIGDVIYVKADSVNISGFKIRRSGEAGNPQYDSGIDIVAGKLCVVSNNILVNNNYGICIRTSKGNRNLITNNTIKINNGGILIDSGSSNILSYNNILDNDHTGIYFYAANNNDIIGNNIINNQKGIVLHVYSHETYIYRNNIDNNGAGIDIISSLNIILYNNILNNSVGLGISSDNINQEVCYNNFIGNYRMISCGSCGHNIDSNYWNRPRDYPKIIIGWKEIKIEFWINFYIDIPVLMYDWHPASEPYDI